MTDDEYDKLWQVSVEYCDTNYQALATMCAALLGAQWDLSVWSCGNVVQTTPNLSETILALISKYLTLKSLKYITNKPCLHTKTICYVPIYDGSISF